MDFIKIVITIQTISMARVDCVSMKKPHVQIAIETTVTKGLVENKDRIDGVNPFLSSKMPLKKIHKNTFTM